MLLATCPHCEAVNRYEVNTQSYTLEKTYRTEKETTAYTYPPHDVKVLICNACKRAYWGVFIDERW